MSRAYKIVDVFTSTPLRGNPLAVVLDADDLDTETMQAVAAWTNLSETTFVLPPSSPKADYRLRIFTPRSELPLQAIRRSQVRMRRLRQAVLWLAMAGSFRNAVSGSFNSVQTERELIVSYRFLCRPLR